MFAAQAQPGDLIAMMGAAAPNLRLTLNSRVYRGVALQIICSEAYALYETFDAHAPFAIVGGAPLPDETIEVFFVVRPGGLPPALLLALVRFGKSLLDNRPPAICHVDAGSSPGARLARLIGFSKSDGRIGSREEWRRGHG